MAGASIATAISKIIKELAKKGLIEKIRNNFDFLIMTTLVFLLFVPYFLTSIFVVIINPRYATGTNEYGNLSKEKVEEYNYLQYFLDDKLPWQFIYSIEEYYELKDIEEYIWQDDLSIFWDKNFSFWEEEQKKYYHIEFEPDEHGKSIGELIIDDNEKYYHCEDMMVYCESMIEKIAVFLEKSEYNILGGWVQAELDDNEEETGYYYMFLGAFRMPFNKYIEYTGIAPELIKTTPYMKSLGIEDRKVPLYRPCTIYDKKDDKNILGDGVIYLISIKDVLEEMGDSHNFYEILLRLGFDENDAYLIEKYARCIMRWEGWEDETLEEQRTTKTCERLYEEYLNLPEGYYEELSDEKLDSLLNCSYSFPVGGSYHYNHDKYSHHNYPAKDIYSSVGTPVYTVTSGVISNVNKTDLYNCATKSGPKGGISFLLNGDDGFKYYYAHLSQIYVNNGQKVNAGYLAGNVGATGNCCGVNPHLHLGLSKGGKIGGSIDPTAALNYWEACK